MYIHPVLSSGDLCLSVCPSIYLLPAFQVSIVVSVLHIWEISREVKNLLKFEQLVRHGTRVQWQPVWPHTSCSFHLTRAPLIFFFPMCGWVLSSKGCIKLPRGKNQFGVVIPSEKWVRVAQRKGVLLPSLRKVWKFPVQSNTLTPIPLVPPSLRPLGGPNHPHFLVHKCHFSWHILYGGRGHLSPLWHRNDIAILFQKEPFHISEVKDSQLLWRC